MTATSPYAAVIGWPAAHSLSPLIMRTWLEAKGLVGDYGIIECPDDRFEGIVKGLAEAGLAGLNVTVPHKLGALGLADQVSDAAKAVGAANLLVFQSDGTIRAENTDIVGIEAALEGDDGQSPAVLIGAGGAARAAAYYLSRQDRKVRLVNRTVEKAETINREFDLNAQVYPEPSAQALEGAGLVINATSLGMGGQNDLSCPFEVCAQTALVFDMVYTPLETGFLKAAKAAGHDTRDGLVMLVGQARPSFEAFFGAPAPDDDKVRDLLIKKLGL